MTLFDIDYTLDRRNESWVKVTPQKLTEQRAMVILYLKDFPLSTHIEICEGLRNAGYLFRDSSVQRTLTNLKDEKDSMLDVSQEKWNKEHTREVTAYQWNGK